MQPGAPEQGVEIQLHPWNWGFDVIMETPMGKLCRMTITRPLGEVIQHAGILSDLERFHEALGVFIAEQKGTLAVAHTMPPINGFGGKL